MKKKPIKKTAPEAGTKDSVRGNRIIPIQGVGVITKIMLLNLTGFIVFGLILGIIGFSFQNVETMISRMVDESVTRIEWNARLEREISRIFSSTNLLMTVFFRSEGILKRDSRVILDQTEALNRKNREFRNYLNLRSSDAYEPFIRQLLPLFSQCAAVNASARVSERQHLQLAEMITRLDEIVTENIMDSVPGHPDAADHQPIGIMLFSFRETLLRIGVLYHQLEPLSSNVTSFEKIKGYIDTLLLKTRILLAASPEIAAIGDQLFNGLNDYDAALTRLHNELIEFKNRHNLLLLAKERIDEGIADMDAALLETSEKLRGQTVSVLKDSLRSIFVLSGLVTVFFGIFTYFLLTRNIRKPIEMLCKGIVGISEGGFDTRIDLNRKDEWHLIEDALNRMISEISDSHQALSQKNRELKTMHRELESSMESLKQEMRQRKAAEEERESLQRRLMQSRKMEALGTLAGGVAHDFNNLLQGIQGYAELLMIGLSEDHGNYRKLRQIIDATQKGGNLVRRLLILTRQKSRNRMPLNMNRKVEIAKEILKRTFPENIEIQLNLDEDLHMINGDSFQLEQMLVNLGGNAGDAMPDGGMLRMETRNVIVNDGGEETGDLKIGSPHIRVRVEDNGAGIAKESLDQIFDPFFTTKDFGKGSGLGLSMALGIVRQHEGHIHCDSEAGKGTAFTIYLPSLETEKRSSGDGGDPLNQEGKEMRMTPETRTEERP